MSIGSFKNKETEALVTCNKANKQYRRVKFYADDDFNIAVSADAILSGGSCGSECPKMVLRMIDIVDEMYPAFMKALWG